MQNNDRSLQTIKNIQTTATYQSDPLQKVVIQRANTIQTIPTTTILSTRLNSTNNTVSVASTNRIKSCKIGELTVTKSSPYASSTVYFKVSDSKNVGYFHWSYLDSYSEPGHNSASGGNISRLHAHSYSHAGTFRPVLYAYASLEAFKARQSCDSKSLSLTIKPKPEIIQKNGWQWPTKGKIISKVGMRHQPVTGEYRMHQGIDIQNVKGTRVNAARDGRVVATNSACHSSASNCGGGYGNYVVIRHSNGLYSIYAHLLRINTRVGENVSAGEKIGEMGNTGLTHTVHLHFGIGPTLWVNSNVKDPLKVLPASR